MSINFTPKGGDLLLCDFGPDPRAPGTYPVTAGPVAAFPEMIKPRHAVVISTNRDLIVVAPFSTVRPPQVMPYHFLVPAGTYPFFTEGVDSWLKADALLAASRSRLDRLYFDGKYQRAALSDEDFLAVRGCVLNALGLGTLTRHLKQPISRELAV